MTLSKGDKWPDPIHRAYLTLLAQRDKRYIERLGRVYDPRQSRRELRKLARKIASKERGVFDWTGTANVLNIEPHKAGAVVSS